MSCSFSAVAQRNNVVEEVAWVVGDDAIFKSDVEEYISAMEMKGEPIPSNPYCVMAEELAIRQLMLHQAELDSIPVNEEGILRMLNSTLEEAIEKAGSKEVLEARYGQKLTQIKESLRQNYRENALIEGVKSDITSKVTITPAEVRAYVKEMVEDSIPFIPAQVEVELLVREPVVPQMEIDRIKEELRDYTDRVNNGMSFSSLAILYSEDPASARRGGEVGFTTKADLDPAFAAVAFALQDPQKVSRIVQTEYGYHIIQLIEKRGDRINCRHILRKPKVSDAEITSTLNRLDSVANDIRIGKYTFEAAVPLLSEDKDTYRSNGLMQNPYTGTSRFEMEHLPQEVAKVVDKMNVNEISQPFLMMNKNGKEVCAIVKLKSRIPAHRASVTEDYALLQNMVLSIRQHETLMKWIRDKQKKTFVRINENWRQCEFKYPDWKL